MLYLIFGTLQRRRYCRADMLSFINVRISFGAKDV